MFMLSRISEAPTDRQPVSQSVARFLQTPATPAGLKPAASWHSFIKDTCPPDVLCNQTVRVNRYRYGKRRCTLHKSWRSPVGDTTTHYTGLGVSFRELYIHIETRLK